MNPINVDSPKKVCIVAICGVYLLVPSIEDAMNAISNLRNASDEFNTDGEDDGEVIL